MEEIKKQQEQEQTLPEIDFPEEERITDIFSAISDTATSFSNSSSNSSNDNSLPELPNYKIVVRSHDFLLFEIMSGKLIGNFPIELLPISTSTSRIISLRIGDKVISALVTYSKK